MTQSYVASKPGITIAAADRFDASMHIQMALQKNDQMLLDPQNFAILDLDQFQLESKLFGMEYLVRISCHEAFPALFALKCLARLISMMAPNIKSRLHKTKTCVSPYVTVKVVFVVK